MNRNDREPSNAPMDEVAERSGVSRRGLLRSLGVAAAELPLLDLFAGEAHALSVGSRLPSFALPDLRGRTFRSSQLRGKVVFLDVWASWCEPCREEFPVLNRLQRQYRRAD